MGANFENCLNNINSTSNNQFLALCPLSSQSCVTVSYYNASSYSGDALPAIAVQRMCSNVTAMGNVGENITLFDAVSLTGVDGEGVKVYMVNQTCAVGSEP